MGGEYCTCPAQPCPICRDRNICGCGCGFEVGSEEFQNLHVENPEEEFLQGMSEQEWREECNPSLSEIMRFEQLKRRDY